MENNKALESNSYLSFKVGGELFAAHVSKVLNILDVGKITKVPQAPSYMLESSISGVPYYRSLTPGLNLGCRSANPKKEIVSLSMKSN